MLQITVRGEDEVQRRLVKFASAMAPRQREINNKAAAIQLYGDVIRTFKAQGATEGRPRWADLKAGGRYTGTGRKRKDGSRGPRRFQTAYQILQDTGALRQSFIPLHDQTLAGVGAASVKGHADLAPIHEFGSAKRNIPARPMLPSRERAMSVMTQIYQLGIERAVRP
jgi:phage gpG-like protein